MRVFSQWPDQPAGRMAATQKVLAGRGAGINIFGAAHAEKVQAPGVFVGIGIDFDDDRAAGLARLFVGRQRACQRLFSAFCLQSFERCQRFLGGVGPDKGVFGVQFIDFDIFKLHPAQTPGHVAAQPAARLPAFGHAQGHGAGQVVGLIAIPVHLHEEMPTGAGGNDFAVELGAVAGGAGFVTDGDVVADFRRWLGLGVHRMGVVENPHRFVQARQFFWSGGADIMLELDGWRAFGDVLGQCVEQLFRGGDEGAGQGAAAQDQPAVSVSGHGQVQGAVGFLGTAGTECGGLHQLALDQQFVGPGHWEVSP